MNRNHEKTLQQRKLEANEPEDATSKNPGFPETVAHSDRMCAQAQQNMWLQRHDIKKYWET